MAIRSSLALAFGLGVASAALFTAPAAAEECKVVKEGDGKKGKKWDRSLRQCGIKCFDGAPTAVVSDGMLQTARGFAFRIIPFTATDAGRYYVQFNTDAHMERIKGERDALKTRKAEEYAVQAAQDPLVVVFEDQSEIQLSPACDASSHVLGDKNNQHLCVQYVLNRDDLEQLAKKKLRQFKQFVTGRKELESFRLKRPSDGHLYFDIPVKEQNAASLMGPAACMLDAK